MSGLNNPRGLAFGPDGALFVAEAGRGGSGPCWINAQQVCYGPTGAVGRLWQGKQDTVVSGLPSYANAAGRAEGPNAVGLLGMGGAYVTIGLETDPTIRTQAPELAGFARLVHVSPTALVPGQAHPPSNVSWEFVADLGTYEIDVNPDCGRIDSNPFAVLPAPGGVIVADAGGNALIRRGANGDLSTFAAFPSRYTTPQGPQCPAVPADYPTTLPNETVPTSIAVGPDGAYYVVTDIARLGGTDDVEFVRMLVTQVGVAGVPGSSFYAPKELGRIEPERLRWKEALLVPARADFLARA